MKNLGKTVLFKTMIAVTLILAASLLVTCDGFLDAFQPEGDIEYTDVEYEVTGAPGNERVKTVTVYLMPDGMDKGVKPGPGTYGVKKSAEQRRIERALGLEGARMSHDYFEAVFMPDGTRVARASWEIGQPAGIQGLDRNVGVSYSGVAPGASSSILFVGRKTGKTLLGVGYLTHINNGALTTFTTRVVDGNTESVTFTVSALATWLGFNVPKVGTPPNQTDGPSPYGPNLIRKDLPTGDVTTTYATFITAYEATFDDTNNIYTSAGEGVTKGEIVRPRGTGAQFPLYYLPSVKPAALEGLQLTVDAAYKIGGFQGTDLATTAPAGFPSGGLNSAVLIWGTRGGTDTYPETGTVTATNFNGGLQWIKRTPAFMVAGVNYEINDTVHDKVTQIEDTTRTGYPAANSAFPAALPVQFIQSAKYNGKTSYGIFAVTFQVPVYALNIQRAYNAGTLAPEKWWIRPDYSQYQYLLDNGTDSGGAVLLGTDVQGGGGDWIQINTKGIGFDNE